MLDCYCTVHAERMPFTPGPLRAQSLVPYAFEAVETLPYCAGFEFAAPL